MTQNIDYKKKAEQTKRKTIEHDIKKFKKICMKEFNKNVKKGLDTTFVEFASYINSDFRTEIADIVLSKLKDEHPNIDFSIYCRTTMRNSSAYKGIKMIAISLDRDDK